MDSALTKLLVTLESAPTSLIGIFAEWEHLDADLRDQYAVDAEWMLIALHRQLLEQPIEEVRAISERIEAALAAVTSLSDVIYDHMGFRPEDVLPCGSVLHMVAARVG